MEVRVSGSILFDISEFTAFDNVPGDLRVRGFFRVNLCCQFYALHSGAIVDIEFLFGVDADAFYRDGEGCFFYRQVLMQL